MKKIQDRMKKLETILDPETIARAAYPVFYKNTPKGKPSLWKKPAPPGYVPGNARKETVLKKDEIHARYPYAQRLDSGKWSTQNPEGMVKPTLEFIREYIKKNVG